jgi:hypothetical protein
LKLVAIRWTLRDVVVLCVVLAWSESVQRFLGLSPGAAIAVSLSVFFCFLLLVGGLPVSSLAK